MTIRLIVRSTLLLALATPFAACSKADSAPPVATVSFSPSKTRVPLGSPVDLTYKFDVAPNAKIDGDYRVFFHLQDSDGKNLWIDDHTPPVPTSQWKSGQKIEYTLTRFVPVVPYVGEATVRVGLYKPSGERLPLVGDSADRAATDREYKVGTLQLLPQSENVFVMKKAGWHPPEFAPENPTIEWSWTQKLAVLNFQNPRKDVTLYFQYDARPDVFDHPQQVTISSAGQPVDTFAADSSDKVMRRIPITAAQLGTNEMAEVRIEVDRTFTPAKLPTGGTDARELGIRVYHHFIEPR